MKTEDILFALLRHAVCAEALDQKTISSCTPENLGNVHELARKHDLAHLVAYALEDVDISGSEMAAKLKKIKMMAVYRFAKMDFELERICRILEEAEIPFIPLKGSVLRCSYPEPWMRTSCDIDVLVKPENLEKAVLLLEENGFQRKGKGHHDVSLYSTSGVHVELHYDLIEEAVSPSVQRILKDVWNFAVRKSGKEMEFILPDAVFYFYHVAHMAKHFVQGGGCGIRPFLDIWVMDRCAQEDREGRDTLMQQGGLSAFAKASEKLSQCWFANAPWDDNTLMFADCVIDGGRIGTRENRAAMHKAVGKEEKIPWNRIVIPYEDLRYSYPILDKKPWLMPVFQIARWFRLLKNMIDLLRRKTETRNVSQESENEMQKIFQYLKL